MPDIVADSPLHFTTAADANHIVFSRPFFTPFNEINDLTGGICLAL
jgi:hypothetical protein